MRGRARVEGIVKSTPWLMAALTAARAVDAPDWLIGAGAVRTAVWDRLHHLDQPSPLADIDLAFFDPRDLSRERDREVERALRAQLPEVPWEAKNQAAVHIWYPDRFGEVVPPLHSSADAVATWPETATCVGVRLDQRDRLTIVAPYGLDDLLGLIYRRNPRRVTVEEYERRLTAKRIGERWPRVTVLPER
jgi:uncharacterized protein